ncbi:hypothetical protein D3C87_1867130 [compost metagenome]
MTTSNIFNVKTIIVVVTVRIVAEMNGIIMPKKIFTSPAPSTRAASRISSGTPLIAAEKITIAKPVCIQIKITMRKKLFQGCSILVQACGSPPK